MKILKHLTVIGCITVLSITIAYCMCELADHPRLEPKPELYPAVMARIDSLQGLTPLMKETALNRLSKLSTDSVEKIIKQAGY